MNNINEEIKKDLKEGKIKFKENSESIYYDFEKIDKNEDGSDKKYFELDDLFKNETINKYINLYMINSKKGIGKTFQLRKKMLECEKENKLFMFIRRIEPDIENQKIEWNNWSEWPFFIRGKSIYRKDNKKFVGRITTISTLYSETGLEFPNFKYIFFDEYKDKRGINWYVKNEFNKFVKFMIDVQRNKKDLKIFMFANDETKHDPYTTGFNIDASVDYFIDLEAGFFYVNLKNKFNGAITTETVGARLAKYNLNLIDELKNNKTVFQNENNLLDVSNGKIDEPYFYFYLNKKLYLYGINNKINKLIIKSVNNKDYELVVYSLTTNDYIAFEKTTRPSNIYNFTKTFYNLLYKKLLWFVNFDDKFEMEQFIEKVVGKIKVKPAA